MRYSDIKIDYLSEAIDRIKGGLETVGSLPVMINPMADYYEKAVDSYWAIGAVLMANTDQSADMSTQLWSVASQLIWHPAETREKRYDATIYSAMYALVPKVFNYMQAHRNLIFKPEQLGIPYLNPSGASVALNSINANGQPGFAIIHKLPFRISIEQEYE